MAETKQRIYYLDCLRVFAFFLVVLTHSQMPNISANGMWVSGISFFCSPSSELFLALSGAILLPVHTDFSSFYKRRFLKLLPPMVIWSVFGVCLGYFQGKITGIEAVEKLLFIPVKPVEGVYWFLYVMIGLYLFAPIISYWLRQATKKQVRFFLLIWAINLCLPWLNLLKPGFYNEDGSYYWIFCYFGGFLGYWVLGYYLRKYPPRLLSKEGGAIIILSVCYLAAYVVLSKLDISGSNGNLQIGSAILVTLIFMVVKAISDSKFGSKFLNKPASFIAQYSFGTYLIHIYVIRDFVWKLFENHRLYDHPVIEALLITIISIFVCILFMKILSTVYKPLGKWLFGLK